MFIKKIKKTNGRSKKKYSYLHLVESIRTEAGPRQRLILNLGDLDIDSSQYTELAQRIEQILTGQNQLFSSSPKIEKDAQDICKKIFTKKAETINNDQNMDIQSVDVNTLSVSLSRTLGAEYICHSIWKELKLDDFLLSQKISKQQLSIIKALVIGRLIEPASELHTKGWVENRSALYELCGSPLRASKNSYYLAGDLLFRVKDALEEYLSGKEEALFPTEEHMFFYDLTNSYFEGECWENPKAKYGRSKEKRSDCKLQTLGMIIDQFGFPKYTKLFAGNQCEATTLAGMIEHLNSRLSANQDKTIIMDAGIATNDNLSLLKNKGYKYIVVNRGKAPFKKDFTDMEIVREDLEKGTKVEIKKIVTTEDTFILCHSIRKQQKEESMRNRVEQLLLERLKYYKEGLIKKGHIKSYSKLLESIGRLKEKYPKVAKLYEIEVIPDSQAKGIVKNVNAVDISWVKKTDKYNGQINDEGSYVLRTNRTDLSSEEIFNIYIMQGNIEKAFLNMKSHLGLRPNFHIKEERVDAHMFITVIAYHLLNTIEQKLKRTGDKRKWSTIRDIMSTQQRVTIEYVTVESDGTKFHNQTRVSTKLEAEHVEILSRLGLSLIPLKSYRLSKSVVTTKKRE